MTLTLTEGHFGNGHAESRLDVNRIMHTLHKNGLPFIPNQVYGYNAPAKSGAGIGLPEITEAIHDAPGVFFCVVSSAHLFFGDSGIIRVARKVMVGCVGASSGAPGSFVSGKTNSAQSITSKIGLFGDGLNHTKEIIIMMTAPAQSQPKFIWIIAAVRRDCPTIKPVLHHIAAVSEHEARRSLARDHVCFFAGRIRQADLKTSTRDSTSLAHLSYQTSGGNC
ncbi:fructokinase [Klebsiella quasipneumoniae]|nr:fructokinase [Klebsiella quasipneumoniae]